MKKNPNTAINRTLFCLLLLFVSSFPNLLFAQLAGNYTINPNQPASATNYLTFTSAVSDLVSGTRSDGGSKNGPGVKAAVVFNVADGTYEEWIKIKSITGTSIINTVTFQSNSNDSSKVILTNTLNNNKSVLNLDSVEYLVFQALTIKGEEYGNPVISLLAAHNNKFIRNMIRYPYYQDMIDIGGWTLIEVKYSNFNVFENNHLKYGMNCLSLFGGLSTPQVGNTIKNNLIDSAEGGIQGFLEEDLTISGNILIGNKSGISVTRASEDVKVFNNYIANKQGFEEYGGFVIGVSKGNLYFYNNMTPNPVSISASSGIIKIYNNNIARLGISPLPGKPQVSSLEIFNNNINNKGATAIKIDSLKYFSIKSDNNNFYSTGSTLAIIDGVNYKNLYAFRQITKTDSNSISVNPAYVSSTDLHVRNPALDGKGKPFAEIKVDFDGEQRSLTAPDIGADEFTPVFSATDSVWPGDANYDRIANVWDVLNIGVAYNATGTSRTNASTNWTAQAATDWNNAFSNGLNYKHADCNGDGKVDINDLQPILLNYGKTHNKTGLNKTGTQNDPALYVQFPKDSFLAGDTVVADLYLGTNSISVSNGYGFAFTLNYNPKYVDSGSFSIDLSSSWFGKQGTDLIYLMYDNYNTGQVDVGITRINQKNVSGYGKIGTASFVLQENIAAKRWINRTITLEPSDVKMISADETEIPIFTIADSVKAHQFTGIKDARKNAENEIRIYPNPVQDLLTIDAGGQNINEVRIINMLGQVVYSSVPNADQKLSFSTVNFPKGIYTIMISSGNGIISKQIFKY